MKNQAQIAQLLSQNGIRPSVQRVVILEYLRSVKSHPSADQVYEALADKLHTLSKATVYNTLNLFIEKGVARLVTIDPAEKRFDGDVELHAHFRCAVCGKLEDFRLDQNQLSALDFKTSNKIFSTDIYLNGVCTKCSIGE